MPGRSVTYNVSDDRKKEIVTFKVTDVAKLANQFSIDHWSITLKIPIANDLKIKVTVKQGEVDLTTAYNLSFYNSSSSYEAIGEAPINGAAITLTNLNDVLTDGKLYFNYMADNLDNTNTADIVLTIEIIN